MLELSLGSGDRFANRPDEGEEEEFRPGLAQAFYPCKKSYMRSRIIGTLDNRLPHKTKGCLTFESRNK
jgi:hypothetical protein